MTFPGLTLDQNGISRINSGANRDFRKIAILGQNRLHVQFWSSNPVLVHFWHSKNYALIRIWSESSSDILKNPDSELCSDQNLNPKPQRQKLTKSELKKL